MLWSTYFRGRTMSTPVRNLHLSTWMLVACGIWLVLLGLYFMFLRPTLLPEDARFMGSTLAQVLAAAPGLQGWLHRVFAVMGGFMAATGVLIMFVAYTAMRSRLMGASWIIAVSGVLTVVLMSAINFDLNSEFRWLLLVPALVWIAGFVLHLARR